jgi:hypothetical protein
MTEVCDGAAQQLGTCRRRNEQFCDPAARFQGVVWANGVCGANYCLVELSCAHLLSVWNGHTAFL